MERDVEEENELVTLWINDRELDVKKILNCKRGAKLLCSEVST